MTWIDAVQIILWAMGLLILIGLGRKLEAKLDAALNLVASLTTPPKGVAIGELSASLRAAKAEMEKTVYHLTPEHDAKVLGDDDL